MSHAEAVVAGSAGPRVPTWNLALGFQEALTAVLRLRFDGEAVPDADAFRAHMKSILGAAGKDADAHGYSAEEIRAAMFAIVAFLDESVLSSHNPIFAEWPRLPLQEELFGGHVAGEIFFQNLRSALAKSDAPRSLDLLEVYYLCLLLGYRGRYGASGAGELHALMTIVRERLERGRGTSSLTALAAIPLEPPPQPKSDPWVRRFKLAACAALLLALLLFAVFKVILV